MEQNSSDHYKVESCAVTTGVYKILSIQALLCKHQITTKASVVDLVEAHFLLLLEHLKQQFLKLKQPIL